MCFGRATTKDVLMSMLAKYIVGRITLPCLIIGLLPSCNSRCFCSSCVLTLFSENFARACETESIVISAPRLFFVHCWSPFLLKDSILSSCASFVSSRSMYTSSHSSLSSVNLPLTYNSVKGFLFSIFFPGIMLHFTA